MHTATTVQVRSTCGSCQHHRFGVIKMPPSRVMFPLVVWPGGQANPAIDRTHGSIFSFPSLKQPTSGPPTGRDVDGRMVVSPQCYKPFVRAVSLSTRSSEPSRLNSNWPVSSWSNGSIGYRFVGASSQFPPSRRLHPCRNILAKKFISSLRSNNHATFFSTENYFCTWGKYGASANSILLRESHQIFSSYSYSIRRFCSPSPKPCGSVSILG